MPVLTCAFKTSNFCCCGKHKCSSYVGIWCKKCEENLTPKDDRPGTPYHRISVRNGEFKVKAMNGAKELDIESHHHLNKSLNHRLTGKKASTCQCAVDFGVNQFFSKSDNKGTPPYCGAELDNTPKRYAITVCCCRSCYRRLFATSYKARQSHWSRKSANNSTEDSESDSDTNDEVHQRKVKRHKSSMPSEAKDRLVEAVPKIAANGKNPLKNQADKRFSNKNSTLQKNDDSKGKTPSSGTHTTIPQSENTAVQHSQRQTEPSTSCPHQEDSMLNILTEDFNFTYRIACDILVKFLENSETQQSLNPLTACLHKASVLCGVLMEQHVDGSKALEITKAIFQSKQDMQDT